MGAYRWPATWRQTTFNARLAAAGADIDDPARIVTEALVNDDIYLDELDITRVSVQDYRELRQYLEGSEPNEAYEGLRAIAGSGRIIAPSLGQLDDKVETLYEQFSPAACRAAFAANGFTVPPGVGAFDFLRDTGATWGVTKARRLYCRPASGRPIIVGRHGDGLAVPFAFSLVAFDPFTYDQAEVETDLGVGGGNVSNPGNVYTKPRIRIVQSGAGAATFTITNTTTGQSIQLNLSSLGAGTNIEIQTSRSTITNTTGTVDRYSLRVAGFMSSLYLVPGVNAITFANTGGVSQVQFFVRGAYA
jgi:hypothetical protein